MDSLLNIDTYLDSAKGLTVKMVDKIPDMIVAALTLVAALTWNEAAQRMITYYTPESWKREGKSNPWVQVGYAVVLTIVITVVVTMIVFSQSRVQEILV